MNLKLVAIILFSLMACQNNNKKQMKENLSFSFYVGTYTKGESEGIYKYTLKENGQLKKIGLASIAENPSFLAMSADRKYLLSVNENREGTIESYHIDGASLNLISRRTSAGSHPCFVAINREGYAMTANYTGGNIGLFKLGRYGELSEVLDFEHHTGKFISERQNAPHAHSVWFEPDGNGIISIDLGTNELFFYKLDSDSQKLITADVPKLQMAPGAGPRHLVFHPNGKWVYVVNELNSTVTFIRKDETGIYNKVSSISTLPENFTDSNTCADIGISSDGKFVYASNRGHNSLAIFNVHDDGKLVLSGHESTRGKGPRNFSFSPDGRFILVANQHTNNIVSFLRDKQTGLLHFVDEIKAPTPVCILF